MSLLEHIDTDYEFEPRLRLLLQALTLGERRGEESLSRWLAEVDFDSLEENSLRLVPALFDKFAHTIGNSIHAEKIKGVYRYHFSRNGMFIAESRCILERLFDAGIDVLLFKGLAITLKYHKNIAVRPMADIDVLVRPESVMRAEEILRQCGWKFAYPEEMRREYLHSYDYIKPGKGGFDLHWYSLVESIHTGIDDGIWERAEFFDWNGIIVKLMSPEDLLLTSVVNGMRDIQSMKVQWIYDLSRIVSSEPAILWPTLWNEARNRGLRQTVFSGLDVVRRISAKIIPDALLDTFLDSDPNFCRDLFKAAIAEGRTHRLGQANREKLEAVLLFGNEIPPAMEKGSAYAEIASASGSPKHIRYFLNKDGAIEKLFLQLRHMPLLTELFEVRDHRSLEEVIAGCAKTGEGYVSIPPGLLALKPKSALSAYAARIVLDGPQNLRLAPGALSEITIEVENNSPCCWPVCDGSSARFGVSYHLLSDAGQLMAWEMPRTYLPVGRKGYVAFIEPAQRLTCKLKVIAPIEPGRYVVQLDLVQELVEWFSRRGVQFPRIAMEVREERPSGVYVVNGAGIFHETIGQETIIINTVSGTYYAINAYGSLIWNALADGHSANEIISIFASSAIFTTDAKVVERFISQLIAEKLIAVSDADGTGFRGKFRPERLSALHLPGFTKYSDLKDLIAMHPVRNTGASAHVGWPFRDSRSV